MHAHTHTRMNAYISPYLSGCPLPSLAGHFSSTQPLTPRSFSLFLLILPASRARIRCPFPVSSVAARFFSPAAAGLEARVGPRKRPLHPTSLPGRPFPTVRTAHPKARRCEHVVWGGDFTTCTGIIFVGGERTVP